MLFTNEFGIHFKMDDTENVKQESTIIDGQVVLWYLNRVYWPPPPAFMEPDPNWPNFEESSDSVAPRSRSTSGQSPDRGKINGCQNNWLC